MRLVYKITSGWSKVLRSKYRQSCAQFTILIKQNFFSRRSGIGSSPRKGGRGREEEGRETDRDQEPKVNRAAKVQARVTQTLLVQTYARAQLGRELACGATDTPSPRNLHENVHAQSRDAHAQPGDARNLETHPLKPEMLTHKSEMRTRNQEMRARNSEMHAG